MLVLTNKKLLIRILLITVGFFGTPALFRATGAADHVAQVQSAGYCYISMVFLPSSHESCLRKRLGGKPFWDLRRRDEYQQHWVAGTYVVSNGLRWQLDITPWHGLGMAPRDPEEIFALRIELTYPKWWSAELIRSFQMTGTSARWSELKSVGDSPTVFEAYTPFTKSLAARMTDGEAIQIEAEHAERILTASLPSMPTQTHLALMEPQDIADKVSLSIANGEVPRSIYGSYALQREGDRFTLVVGAGDKPLAHWQLKTAQRTIKYASGARYQGVMRAGKYHGRGSYYWSGGDVYTGDWVNGQRTGQGVYVWPNGDRYEGDFVNGKHTGKGVFTWASGNQYRGDFVDGEHHGQGLFIWKSGDRYEGDFVNGKRTGEGVLSSANGDEYRGEFVDGRRHGHGTYKSPEGGRYEGEWKDNKRHGYGEYTSSGGISSFREYYWDEWVRAPELEVVERSNSRKGCGSYENPCEIPSETGIEGFAKSLARTADQVFGSSQSGGRYADREAEIKAENEKRWLAYDRKLKREAYEAKVSSDLRKKKRAAERSEYNRHNGTCDETLELDGQKKAWYYIWSSKVCGRWGCDDRSNEQVETRVFVSNLVYAHKFDHDNLAGGFHDQIGIQYQHKSHNSVGIESNGYVCRGDARNARRKFIANHSGNERTYIFDVDLPEYP